MLRPFFIHCRPSADHDERFDTVMMMNGSVAVLNNISRDLTGTSGLAIDETWMGPETRWQERTALLDFLSEEIERALANDDEPIVFCTLMSYNAGNAIRLLENLKRAFGSRLRTGVGGQLTRVHPEAYVNNPAIDHVSVGDAEVTLGPLLLERKRFVRGYKMVTAVDHYATPLYENYLGLDSRLDEMSRYEFGPFRGIRQLVTESVRGCSWANAYKVCKFCSLQGVDTAPMFRSIPDHLRIERELAERHGANWIFDVSNLWLPTVNKMDAQAWLRNYLRLKEMVGGPALNRYVYMTSNTLTPSSARLLYQAGVRIVYIGLDGWDAATNRALYKPKVHAWKPLAACRDAGIKVRTSTVIGSGLTRENIRALPDFVANTLAEYGDTILSWGNFLEIVLPGSENWQHFERESERHDIVEVKDIFRFFREHGYLPLDLEDRLTELRIRHHEHDVPFEDVIAARDAAVAAVKQSSAFSVTIRECEKLDAPPD
ncbi:hypothetical protein EDM68_01400 [Candidatus Uhrbacteria bacterium]|nr:MAG: hypothetical protein EDM68_01400 [Candidatus Uhrbacteria bacterium]